MCTSWALFQLPAQRDPNSIGSWSQADRWTNLGHFCLGPWLKGHLPVLCKKVHESGGTQACIKEIHQEFKGSLSGESGKCLWLNS